MRIKMITETKKTAGRYKENGNDASVRNVENIKSRRITNVLIIYMAYNLGREAIQYQS